MGKHLQKKLKTQIKKETGIVENDKGILKSVTSCPLKLTSPQSFLNICLSLMTECVSPTGSLKMTCNSKTMGVDLSQRPLAAIYQISLVQQKLIQTVQVFNLCYMYHFSLSLFFSHVIQEACSTSANTFNAVYPNHSVIF